MKVVSVNITIADYCAALARQEIVVDRTYQRSDLVWPLQARSYLIETILRSFPIPKLTLHQRTDLRTRRTKKAVVDGQQRTSALFDFFEGRLRLSKAIETKDAAGRVYSELPDELQVAFLSYILNCDQFEAATEDDVREYYRRINSFTAPLTPEEQRHATFQGEMKWFIHKLAGVYEDALVNLGVVSQKRAIRMAVEKLMAEITHAMLNGIRTTSKASLDRMYKEHDRVGSFPEAASIESAVGNALDTIFGLQHVATSALVSTTHIFYSLVLAVVKVQTGWPMLDIDVPKRAKPAPASAAQLLRLVEALDNPDAEPALVDFVTACSERTNVGAQRATRVRFLAEAVAGILV